MKRFIKFFRFTFEFLLGLWTKDTSKIYKFYKLYIIVSISIFICTSFIILYNNFPQQIVLHFTAPILFGSLYFANILVTIIYIKDAKQINKLVELQSNFNSLFLIVWWLMHLGRILFIAHGEYQAPFVLYSLDLLSLRLEFVVHSVIGVLSQISSNLKVFNDSLDRALSLEILERYKLMHSRQLQLIETMQSIYGNLIAVFTVHCICGLAIATYHLIYHESEGFDYYSLLLSMSLWSEVSYLAYVGQNLSEAAERTLEICYKGAEKKTILILKETKQIVKELYSIAQATCQRTTTLNAAGCFDVNHSMMMFLLSNFCNYMLIMVQFMSSELSSNV